MKYQVIDTCDNCFDCLDVCSTDAILRPGEGYETDEDDYEPLSYQTAAIIAERCNGCADNAAPRCVEVCKPAAIVPIG